MKNNTVLDEEKICYEYVNSNIGIESLALQYHVGKKKINDILKKNNIQHKKRGAQASKEVFVVSDYKIEKYPYIEGFHYLVSDPNTNFVSKDISNSGGTLTSYIEKEYAIETPTLYDRRMYYMRTGNYWWEQWLTVSKIENAKTKKCPYCDWETIDLDNKSGMFETHLRKVHGITKLQYLTEHPEERDYFALVNKTLDREMETDEAKFVVCQICGKKMSRINTHHLHLHNMTKAEYVALYGLKSIYSEEFYKTLTEQSSKMNNALNNSTRFSSKDETEIYEYIKSTSDFEVEHTNRKILGGKELDIYIPSKHLAIEYNGNKWHSEYFGHKLKSYHLNKLNECNEKGVDLIQIFEDEYNEKKWIVLDKISHILGNNTNKPKIYARKCNIKEIYHYEAENFLEANHIQGFSSSTVYLGAFYKDKLVAVMTFLSCGGDKWELNRFATNINYICIGLGGKLFKYFTRNYPYTEIKSFADRRWTINSQNNLYVKLGFKFNGYTNPSYTYYNSHIDRFKRFHKFGFRKQALAKKYNFSLTMTEIEMARELGYDRIWDCGLIKYIYRKEELL